LTPYVSRFVPTTIRPRVRSRFEPVPQGPLDGITAGGVPFLSPLRHLSPPREDVVGRRVDDAGDIASPRPEARSLDHKHPVDPVSTGPESASVLGSTTHTAPSNATSEKTSAQETVDASLWRAPSSITVDLPSSPIIGPRVGPARQDIDRRSGPQSSGPDPPSAGRALGAGDPTASPPATDVRPTVVPARAVPADPHRGISTPSLGTVDHPQNRPAPFSAPFNHPPIVTLTSSLVRTESPGPSAEPELKASPSPARAEHRQRSGPPDAGAEHIPSNGTPLLGRHENLLASEKGDGRPTWAPSAYDPSAHRMPAPPPPTPRSPTHVTVSIDRIEITTPSSANVPKDPARRPRRRLPTLEEYVKARGNGGLG
jgi:hypothetical protein